MNCEEVRNQIDSWAPDTGEAGFCAEFHDHLSRCTLCDEYLKDRLLPLLVRSVSSVQIPPDIEDRIIASVRPSTTDSSRRAGRWAVSLAASVLVAVALLWMHVSLLPGAAPQPLSTVSISVNEVKDVQVMFSTQSALEDARVRIGLPDNVTIEGYPGVRKLTWLADLKSGNNMITLPLHLMSPKDGVIEVMIEHEGATKTLLIYVKVGAGVENSVGGHA